MRTALCISAATILLLVGPVTAAAAPEPIGSAEALAWTRQLVPLPKKLEIAGKFVVPTNRLAIAAAEAGDPLAVQAAKELAEAAGTNSPAPADASFTIRLRIDANAKAVSGMKHLDQGYLIRPAEGGAGLDLVGFGPRGLYYAAKTLQQFIRSGKQGDELAIPAVTIADWPDLEDRGFWGGDSYEYLRWMSDRKLNYDEQIAFNGVDKNTGEPIVNLSEGKHKIIEEGPQLGINPVPVVLHLEQLGGSGLFDVHPGLKGVNGREGTICYSNPLFADILARWLLLWRAKPGVREVDVWMTENLAEQKGCQCEHCVKEDRSVLETRAIVAAYHQARKRDPELKVRVLTSEETEKANPRVFAELPMDIKVWYYHSLYTYNTSERPMIRPYLLEEIEKGRWIGVCPNLCANVGCWQPFTGAQFVHYRMNEFVDKGLSGLIGYAVPRIVQVELNAEAAAEWSWNAKGRSPREFAVSFAVRRGYRDPEKFAEWVDVHGPVAWDVYGSEFPSGHQRDFPGKLAALLKAGKLPAFGEVFWEVYPLPWGDIRSADHLRRDIDQADRAVELARELDMPTYLQESLVTQGYVRALGALWRLEQTVKDGNVADADKPAAREAFTAYSAGLEQARVALTAWENSLPGDNHDRQRWVDAPRKVLAEMIEQMDALAKELGCAE